MKKILVVAAHYDDEILGVGGTLLKHKEQGDEIYICIVTEGYEPEWSKEHIKKQERESEEVDRILGTTKRLHCHFPAVKLNTIPSGEFNKKIYGIVNEVNPDIVYTHFEHDINIDHKLVFNAVMVATRPLKDKKIKVLCFETPSSTEWSQIGFKPNHYVNIAGFIDKKVEAFLKYGDEVKEYPHPRSLEALKILAKKRGNEVCMEYSECFIMVREIIK
jgi:N-acetylglucosamine malate deacetylase 1